MSLGKIMELYQFAYMFESHHQQRLAWEDAAKARIARDRAEAQSRAQLRAMQLAHPSGAMGDAKLNDDDRLRDSGLL